MITLYKTDTLWRVENGKEYVSGELRGLSTDTKPTKIGDIYIDNGSVFIEMDTQKIFFYDLNSQTWKGV